MTPLYCVQMREQNIAYKRQNRARSELTVAILYDRNVYDRNCFLTVQRSANMRHGTVITDLGWDYYILQYMV